MVHFPCLLFLYSLNLITLTIQLVLCHLLDRDVGTALIFTPTFDWLGGKRVQVPLCVIAIWFRVQWITACYLSLTGILGQTDIAMALVPFSL